MAQTLEHLLLTVERQAIGIFGGDQVSQQGRSSDAFAQRVYWASRSQDTLITVLLEHRFFLPVFQYLELGGDVLKLFLHLGEEGFDGPGLLFITQQQLDALTQQVIREATLTALGCRRGSRRLIFSDVNIIRELIPQLIDLGFQFGLIEQVDLVRRFLTAGREALDALQAQHLFQQQDVLLALLDMLLLMLELLL